MKPVVDVKSSTYVNFGVQNSENDPKFEVGDHVRISQYKNIFTKRYTVKSHEEVFVIKKFKITVPQASIIEHLHGEEMVGTIHEKKTAEDKLNRKNK